MFSQYSVPVEKTMWQPFCILIVAVRIEFVYAPVSQSGVSLIQMVVKLSLCLLEGIFNCILCA